jgi:hypothetical protein
MKPEPPRVMVGAMNEWLILRITLAAELAAAILLGAGLFTPPAGVLLVTVAATLVFVSWPHEYPLYLLFVAVAIALTGGTGTLGLGVGLTAAVSLEGLRQFGGQRTAPAAVPGLGRDESGQAPQGGDPR